MTVRPSSRWYGCRRRARCRPLRRHARHGRASASTVPQGAYIGRHATPAMASIPRCYPCTPHGISVIALVDVADACRLDSGLMPGVLFRIIGLASPLSLFSAMAITPRNSGAHRIKDSTADSILKSYRGMPGRNMVVRSSTAHHDGERNTTRRCNRGAPPSALRSQARLVERWRKVFLSIKLQSAFFYLSSIALRRLSIAVVKDHHFFKLELRKRLRGFSEVFSAV